MPDAELLRRVEMLEKTIELLQSLPEEVRELRGHVGGVESQILQLRTEMRDEFSATRREMATKAELQDAVAGAVRELSAAIAETRADFAKKFDDADRHAKVLFENAIARLKTLREVDPSPGN